MNMQTSIPFELSEKIGNWKAKDLKIGFVPTMGALHEGHLSLLKLALNNADRVVVSIFVNPTQFAPHEDFDSYPRDVENDIRMLEDAGAHLIYTPSEETIYPDGPTVDLKAGAAAKGLETDFRPHFFDGVVTVVRRLFAQVQPDLAIFGEKDFQQLQVIREMARDQRLNIDIIGAPIIRDEHGLALSSRNAYLNAEELNIARQLNKILRNLPKDPKATLLAAGFDKIDYVEHRWNRILAAAWIGKTRLIDNMET